MRTIPAGRFRAVALLFLLAASYPPAALAGPYEDGDAAFRSRNYAAAMKFWQPLAESGHADAQLGVATLYYSGLYLIGKGLDVDYGEAYFWLSLAVTSAIKDSAQLTATAAHLRDEAKAKLGPEQVKELDQRIVERKIAQAR